MPCSAQTSAVTAPLISLPSPCALTLGTQSFNVPDEAAQAKALLASRASESETKNYCAALMEIATTVAQAYGEFGEFDDEESGGLFGSIVGKITSSLSALSSEDANHPMNVSAAEDTAISALRNALKG